jgi:hypothetical protein
VNPREQFDKEKEEKLRAQGADAGLKDLVWISCVRPESTNAAKSFPRWAFQLFSFRKSFSPSCHSVNNKILIAVDREDCLCRIKNPRQGKQWKPQRDHRFKHDALSRAYS